jgi:hypothetical protein
VVDDIPWENRLDKYAPAVDAESYGLHWLQLFFILVVLVLSTFALVRALKAALIKDTSAMRELNQRRQRKIYHQVDEQDDAIENAYEERRDATEKEQRDL